MVNVCPRERTKIKNRTEEIERSKCESNERENDLQVENISVIESNILYVCFCNHFVDMYHRDIVIASHRHRDVEIV